MRPILTIVRPLSVGTTMPLRPLLFALAAIAHVAVGIPIAVAQGQLQESAELAAAIERLGAADRAERVAAERQLMSAGPKVLEHLPPPEEIEKPAVRSALVRIRKQLEDVRAAEILRSNPVVVTPGHPVTLRPIAGRTGRLVRVPLNVRIAPKLRPLFLAYTANELRLIAADGQSLSAFTPGAKYELPFTETGGGLDLRLDFLSPADRLEEPLELTGRLTTTVAAGEERFAWPLHDNGTPNEQRRGSVRVRLRETQRRLEGIDVEIAVVYDRGGPAFESHRTWVYHNDASLSYAIERDGKTETMRLDHESGFSTIAQSDGGVTLRYRFPRPPAEATAVTFRYVAPTNILDVPVEVAIDGLALSASGRRQPSGSSEH